MTNDKPTPDYATLLEDDIRLLVDKYTGICPTDLAGVSVCLAVDDADVYCASGIDKSRQDSVGIAMVKAMLQDVIATSSGEHDERLLTRALELVQAAEKRPKNPHSVSASSLH